MPWLTAYGNHDGLVQGNFPQSFQLSARRHRPLKIVSLPAGVSPQMTSRAGDPGALAAPWPSGRAHGHGGPAPPRHRTVTRRSRSTSRRPARRGATASRRRTATTAPPTTRSTRGLVRGIVLDTVNPNGEANGSLDDDQFAWLETELKAHSSAGDREPPDRPLQPPHDRHDGQPDRRRRRLAGERVLGDAVRDLLLRYPNVVLWVNGHTHVNAVTPHARPARRQVPGGFWEVNTASHVDFPQQARIVELADNHDGTLSIFGTIVDSAASARRSAEQSLDSRRRSRRSRASWRQRLAGAARRTRAWRASPTVAAARSRTATSS